MQAALLACGKADGPTGLHHWKARKKSAVKLIQKSLLRSY